MRAPHRLHPIAWLVVAVLLLPALPVGAQAPPFASPAFEGVWSRTDRPVAAGAAQRTWLWGPSPTTAGMQEPYANSPGGQRLVQYFDKSRMEITDPAAGAVSNGLLAKELITGETQTGDAASEARAPAWIPVAGDPDDADGPLYATFREYLTAPPKGVGEAITETLGRAGALGADAGLARYGVTAAYPVAETKHTIAAPFWAFLQTTGPVQTASGLETAKLFEPTFFATGLPITEAYWAKVKVAGAPRDVLVQAFERRVLTYTPANPDGFQVEMGNVGRHYYGWRYEDQGKPPAPVAEPVPDGKDASVTPTSGPAGTTFTVTARGFTPNEAISFWLTDPDGRVAGTPAPLGLPHDGQFTAEVTVAAPATPGVWAVTYQGDRSGHQAIVYFRITAAAAPAPTPTPAPAPATREYDGAWRGDTSQVRQPFTFTVRDGAVTEIGFKYRTDRCTVTVGYTLRTPIRIEGAGFARTIRDVDGSTFDVNGRFTSSDAAEGVVKYNVVSEDLPAACRGTGDFSWTANKA